MRDVAIVECTLHNVCSKQEHFSAPTLELLIPCPALVRCLVPVLAWIEFQTKVSEDYAKFCNHREGLYQGLLLVESAFAFKTAKRVLTHGK